MTTTTTSPPTASKVDRQRLGTVAVAAGASGLMVATGFAMLAIVPVVVVARRTFRDPRLTRLRPWAGLLAGCYALPLLLWAALPDRAPSLSKDMHPAFVPVIAAAAAAYVVAWLVVRRATRAR